MHFKQHDKSNLGRKEMRVAPSTIPNAGNGLYATKNYRAGDVVGEYFGRFLKEGEVVPDHKEWYTFTLKNGKIIVPDDECLLSYANDAMDFDYTVQEVLCWLGERKRVKDAAIKKTVRVVLDDVPTTHVLDNQPIRYNIDWEEEGDILTVIAIEPITKGQEMFVYYGKYYWVWPIYDVVRGLYGR
jgi:hypothetical protein